MSYKKFKYEYSKPRRNFGKQPLFQDVKAHMLDSIMPNREEQKLYILRNPVHREVQVTSSQCENSINTTPVFVNEEGINHVEGGWPRDIHFNNEEQVSRHRRRILHEDNYIHTVLNLAPTMTHYVEQNNAIEMYESYFNNMQPQEAKEKYNIRTANTFLDSNGRAVSSVQWTKEKNSKLVVAYCDRNNTYQTGLLSVRRTCHVWDVNQPINPIHYLKPKEPCWQLTCSNVDPDIIIGGLENGTVCVFDMRAKQEAVSSSLVFNSHREPVTCLKYIHSRTNTEFFSGSPDGQCLWWDARDLSIPTDQLPMCVKIKPGQQPDLSISEGVTCLDFSFSLPSRFICGTESGLIINGNRMGKTHSEILSSYWKTHCGIVRAVNRSPCTSRMFLTCGDSTVRIWSDEARTAPIIVTKPYRYDVTDAVWSPFRFSSYMSVCAGGVFYYWDLLRKYKEPVSRFQVSKHGLTKVTPHEKGEMIAVGDDNGSIFLLQLSENMYIPGPRDKNLMTAIYERETHREHIIDTRIKEIHLKVRQAEEAAIAAAEYEEESIHSVVDELLETEDAYFNIVNEELRKMDMATCTSDVSIHK